jgi:hypothetical protein
VAVSVTPLGGRSLQHAVADWRLRFRDGAIIAGVEVPGAVEAVHIEGLIDGDSPAEPQLLTMVLARTHAELVTLTIRTWPRDDLRAHVARVVKSFVVGERRSCT